MLFSVLIVISQMTFTAIGAVSIWSVPIVNWFYNFLQMKIVCERNQKKPQSFRSWTKCPSDANLVVHARFALSYCHKYTFGVQCTYGSNLRESKPQSNLKFIVNLLPRKDFHQFKFASYFRFINMWPRKYSRLRSNRYHIIHILINQ